MNDHTDLSAPNSGKDHLSGKDKTPGFFDKPATRKAIWVILIGLCTVFGLAGFIVDTHGYFSVEDFGLFYAIFGFAVFAFIVLVGQHLRKLLMRPEDYYEGNDDE